MPETFALSCSLGILPNQCLNSSPWQMRPLAPCDTLCSAPIMHLTGFYSGLSLWASLVSLPRCFLLDVHIPTDPILHIFGANTLSVFVMVIPFSPSWWKNTPKANKLKTSLNQIAAFISLNVHILWGPVWFSSQKHEQGLLCTLSVFCLFYRGWYLGAEGFHNLRENVRF